MTGEAGRGRGFPAGSPMARLLAGPLRPGRLDWIGLRPAHRAPVQVVGQAVLAPGRGLEGGRWRGTPTGARQVTLMAAEHLAAIAGFLGLDAVDPAWLRRNLVVSGLNLLALKGGRRLRIGGPGGPVLECSGECHPCSRMEEEFGPGGYNAVRGHGGITARVVSGGTIRLGDAVERLD